MSRHLAGPPSGRAHLAGLRVDRLRSVRLLDGTLGDLPLAGGAATAGSTAPRTELDASGWRLLPAAAEPHAHLDKAFTADRLPPGGDDLESAVSRWRALTPSVSAADIRSRATRAVGRYVANGVTAIRTHVDLLADGDPLRGVDALVRLRDELSGVVTIQVCVLAGPGADHGHLREAVDRGVDVIGGCPHLADDPAAETADLLDVAERTGLPVDLHTDEQTAAPRLDLVDLAQQVIARGLAQRVTASHCVRLGSLPSDRLRAVLELVGRAGIGLVTLPITNLYLQGRGPDEPRLRGMPPLRQILDAGIELAAGGDNVRDPFNPVGTADPFGTTALLMTAGHLGADEALTAVTSGARTVMGLSAAGPTDGAAADLMLVPDVPVADVLAGAEVARIVLRAGVVVADTRVSRDLALADPGPAAHPDRFRRPFGHRSADRHLAPAPSPARQPIGRSTS
ncbi:amidohydrolase family protein [Georgenia sp. Z1491]|uniref:amidohydrolase family protein n=1 Tax=Georgenia sp. Z1491 TaxID=3416707 RepID=UPI003CFB4152